MIKVLCDYLTYDSRTYPVVLVVQCSSCRNVFPLCLLTFLLSKKWTNVNFIYPPVIFFQLAYYDFAYRNLVNHI